MSAWFVSPSVWVWLMPALLVIPNITLAITETYPVTVKTANILLPLGVWLLCTGLSRRTGTAMLCLIPVSVLCAFQIVLIFLYGESIIAIDMFLNVVTTNPSEVGELLGNLGTAMVTVIILYLPPIVAAIIMIRRRRFAPVSALKRVRAAGIAAAVTGLCFTGNMRADRQLFPYNVITNIYSAAVRTDQSLHYRETSAPYRFHATTDRDSTRRQVYVFVIGETSRADNWSLFGYGRPTTPRLMKQKGLIGFGRTLSEVNTTHKSVPMLMSSLDSHSFGDSVNYVRSIFGAFNECGYHTVYISNQRRNHSYIDYFGEEAHTARFLTDSGSPRPDLDLVSEFSHTVRDSGHQRLFVVLHTYGSHFEYNKRYPAGMSVFRPDSKSDAGRDNRTQLVNAYDNTIAYTDSLLTALISTLDSLDASAALMYVSDHGEDIYDDARGRFLHASPVPTYWQLHVPMILWMSDELRSTYPDMWAAAQKNGAREASSSRSVYHTLLDLAGVRTANFSARASLVSPEYAPAPYTYLNDYNESVPLRICGLREPDFIQLEKHGFSY